MSGHQDTSDYNSTTSHDSTHPKWTGRFELNPAAAGDGAASYAHAPEAGDNDPDVYTYEDDNDVDANFYEDGSPDLRVKTTSFDNGEGSAVYDPESGAYDQMLDYTTGSGEYKHYRERMTEDGVFQARDVTRLEDGTRHVHREYVNPITGTRSVVDYEQYPC
ncbi:hypothetical protein BDW75DRAFT_43206 [Aspergillus navahoensis]